MSKSKLVKLLCLLLSFVMAFSLLSACSSKPKQNGDDTSSDSIDDFDLNDDDDYDEDDYDDDEYDDDEDYDDEDYDDEEYDDEDDYDDYEDDYYDDYDETEYLDSYDLKVYNSKAPVITNYRGTSGSVYHAFSYMKNDSTGRLYTDEMRAIELKRLDEFGIKFARTQIDSKWFWDTTQSKWNFKAVRMQYFMDYCKALQSKGITVQMQLGWSFGDIVTKSTGMLSYTPYLWGDGVDYYGENQGVNLSGYSEENARYVIAANRIAYYNAQLLKTFKANGINNVKHVYYYTEPSPPRTKGFYKAEGHYAAEYLLICRNLKDGLYRYGVGDWVTHIGPNQGYADSDCNLIDYVLKRDPDLFDIWTAHHYPNGDLEIDNTYYDNMKQYVSQNVQWFKDAGKWGKNELWWDEIHARAGSKHNSTSSAWLGLQNVICAIAAADLGVNNISWWMIFDQKFTDSSQTGGEFVNGVHICGFTPSVLNSTIPRQQYYFTGLFTRYHGYQNGTVYQTNNKTVHDKTDLYIMATKLEDGNYTITVVNAGIDDMVVNVEFDKAINKTLYRHVENANTCQPTTAAHLADPDKTFVDVQDKFTDIVRGGDLVIYTSCQY